MSKIVNEVATPVATREEYTQKSIRYNNAEDNYNWESIKSVITGYTPEILSYSLLRCLFKYIKYVVADPDNCANEETEDHVEMLEALYYALTEMNEKWEEEE